MNTKDYYETIGKDEIMHFSLVRKTLEGILRENKPKGRQIPNYFTYLWYTKR